MFGGKLVSAVLVGGVAAAVALGGVDARSGRLSAETGTPLLGVNLIQYRFFAPYCWGNHILLDYHQFGTRDDVVPSLYAMRAAGVETLRLQLVHMHGTNHWIPSDGGRVNEPYRRPAGTCSSSSAARSPTAMRRSSSDWASEKSSRRALQ